MMAPARRSPVPLALAVSLAWGLAAAGCGGDELTGQWVPRHGPAAGDTGWVSAAPPGSGPAPGAQPGAARSFRNTYYHFAVEGSGAKERTVYSASCQPIAKVTKAFHDDVCMQGSGRLESGATVSFAKRDCSCASECPRSGQKICFEALDPRAFPSGRGATGKAITPLRTVAVDPASVPLGSSLFIADYVGVPALDGRPHDGCFVAEDRGSKIVGDHLDVFTGSPDQTRDWNQRVPSNRGVLVELCSPRCPATPACAAPR